MKSDKDTNSTHQYTCNSQYGINEKNADIIEFIMDTENPVAKKLLPESEGGEGAGMLNYIEDYSNFNSPIERITRFDIPTVLGD